MISVVILTKNSSRTINKTLASVKDFPEVIVIDTGSTDNTKEIAKSYYNVRLFDLPFTGFGDLRNQGADIASYDWILALDSDEILSNRLQQEIFSLQLNPKRCYEIPFINYYKGRQVKCCGWYPEWHIRLYHKKRSSFDSSLVHEGLQTDEVRRQRLDSPILHTPYLSIHDFLRKMQSYSTLFAEQYKGRKKASFSTAFFHGSFAFFKSYLFKKGVLYGKVGFILATYNASCAFYKYLKLSEANSS